MPILHEMSVFLCYTYASQQQLMAYGDGATVKIVSTHRL